MAFLLRLSCQPSAGSERRYVCPWEGDRSWSAQVRAMLLVWEDKLAGENLERLSRQEGGREGEGRDRIGELRWAERTPQVAPHSHPQTQKEAKALTKSIRTGRKPRAERDTPLPSLPSSLHWPQQCCCLGNHNPPPVPLSLVTPSCLDSPLAAPPPPPRPPRPPPAQAKEAPGGWGERTLSAHHAAPGLKL